MNKSEIIRIATEISDEVRIINTVHNTKIIKKIEKIKEEYLENNYEVSVLLDSLKTSKESKHMIHGLNSCIEHYLNVNNKMYKPLKNNLRFTPPRIKIEAMLREGRSKQHIIQLLTT